MLENRNKWFLSVPIMINLELTDSCNVKCRHCYNFWREEGNKNINKFSREMFDRFLEMVIDAGVFHVVLTGGEPFINFDVLEYGLKRLTENGVSHSINSNLMFATKDKIKRLKDVGLDHVLTSLNSFDQKTNDYITNRKGSFGKILAGIKTAIEEGIRISVNMVVSISNEDHVYETGRLVSELGCQRLFATRTVPNVNIGNPSLTDCKLDIKSAKHVLGQLVRVNKDFKIGIGTLVSYPLCLLGDLQIYSALVGRGCPAQNGNRMSVNVDGTAHACVHEKKDYGNIFDIGIKDAFKKIRGWHNGSYLYKECAGCDYINVCKSGCRMAAYSYNGRLNARDHLMPEGGEMCIKKPYKLPKNRVMVDAINDQNPFIVPKRIRFRKENGFYVLNVRWANAFSIDSNMAQFLIKHQKNDASFTLNDFGVEKREVMLRLLMKDAIESFNGSLLCDEESKVAGASIDPFAIAG